MKKIAGKYEMKLSVFSGRSLKIQRENKKKIQVITIILAKHQNFICYTNPMQIKLSYAFKGSTSLAKGKITIT